ncbi:GDSL-type esterase/lipase family protein [Myxococcaceae bacterium GXIMD 01537]
MALKATSTGLTLVLTIALALGLSLAPGVPDGLRPIPSLRQGPLGPRLLALVLPSRGGRSSPGEGPTEMVADVPPDEPEETAPPPEPTALTAAPPAEVAPTHTADPLGLDGLTHTTRGRALALESLREQMGSRHVDIEAGCRRMGPSGCEESGLAPLFDALAALRADARRQPVRVVTLGDSLIASDHITDIVRDRLQERHGDGGKGFLFPDRPTGAGRGVRAGTATPGWQITRLIDRAYPKERLGFTGVAFASPGTGSLGARFNAEGARQAELFFLAQPGGGAVQLLADGKPLQRVQTRGFTKPEVAFAKLSLPEGTKTLSLQTSGKVELHGVSLESGGPGVVSDTIGLPGASAEVYTRAQYGAFRAQLRHRKPSLVLLMVGGNEAFFLSRDRTTPEEVREQAKKLVKWVREAAPESACLVMSPIDAAVRTMGGELVPRRTTTAVHDIFHEEALAGGCAFWDALAAMGGEGAALRWLKAGLLNEDLVHPRARGSDLLGHLFDLSLARAFSQARPPLVAVADPPGLRGAPATLTSTFQRLRELESKPSGRVGIVQLGASHTSAHSFSDAVREALAKRFGGTGRGFIAAGKASPRLEAAKVTRALEGEWDIQEALGATPGEPWGLSGIRAVGAPGASLSIRFCDGCPSAKEPPARLSLYYLDGPGAGRLEAHVDGEAMPDEAPPPEPLTAPTLRIRSFPVEGPAHELQVRNPSEAPVTVLGAALDLEQPGISYDAAGLPGSTAFTLNNQDPAVLEAQLVSRQPQLLVLWYGTNESGIAELDADVLRREYTALLGRLRKATNAECLLIGPTDRLEPDAEGRWTEAPALGKVLAALPQVAHDAGCAYWSARAAMGGERAMQRWQRAQPALGHEDGVHLTPEGYATLARAFLTDLLGAYDSWKKAGDAATAASTEGH